MLCPQRYPYDDAPDDKIMMYRPSKHHVYTCQVCLKTKWVNRKGAAKHGAGHCEERGWAPNGRIITHTGPRPYGTENYKTYRKKNRALRMRRVRQEQREGTAMAGNVLDSPDRLFPITLVKMTEGEAPGSNQPQEGGEQAIVSGGFAFAVGCSVLQDGNGEVVLTSFGEGEAMMGAVRSALAWARLHRSALAQVFHRRQELVDLRRTDLDYYMDLDYDIIRKSGPSLGLTAACSFVKLMVGIGVHRLVAMTGVVSPSGAVRGVSGLEAKLSYAESSEDFEVVMLPEENAEEARSLVEEHGWSIKLLPVSHMGQVLAHLHLRSLTQGLLAENAGVAAASLTVPPALPVGGVVDYPLAATISWTVNAAREAVFPVTECAVLPGTGRYTYCSLPPEAGDQAVKVWRCIRETCKELKSRPRSPLVTDLDSPQWDVHVDFCDKGTKTMNVGLAMFCSLLGAALGHPIEPTTFFSGAVSLRGKVLSIHRPQMAQVIELVQRGCRRLLVSADSAELVEAARHELLESEGGEGEAAVLDPEVREKLETLEVVALPELVLSTRQMCEAIWPELGAQVAW